MAKTHPHIESPTPDDLKRVAGDRPLVEVYLALHQLVIDAVPDIVNSVDEVDAAIGYGARQYGYDGWGMAAVTPYSKWVSLTLLGGSKLDDPKGILSGSAAMRHVKLSSLEELETHRDVIAALTVAASELNV